MNENLIEENQNEKKEQMDKYNANKLKGYGFIGIIIGIWVGSSFLVQYLEENRVNSLSLTVLTTSLLSLLLFLTPLSSTSSTTESTSHKQSFRIGLGLLPLWFTAHYLYNVSLCSTSVASSTVLSSTSSIFTFLFGYLFRVETVTRRKLAGVLVCFLGVLFVTFSGVKARPSESDSECTKENTLKGDLVALLAAVCYALYSLYIKYFLGDDTAFKPLSEHDAKEEENIDKPQVHLILGYVGLLTAILFIPVILVIPNLTKHLNLHTVEFLLLNGLLNNVLSDYLWARAVILTSPTVVTVGISLTNPLAALFDWIINGVVMNSGQLFGGLLILLGFSVVVVS